MSNVIDNGEISRKDNNVKDPGLDSYVSKNLLSANLLQGQRQHSVHSLESN